LKIDPNFKNLKIMNYTKHNMYPIFFTLSFLLPALGIYAQNAQQNDVAAILKRYAKDYESDVTFKKDVTFAVKVGVDFWQVIAKAKTAEHSASVQVIAGKPTEPTFYFVTDFETLNKIDKGGMNALTASAKAFESDFAPFDVDVMQGYQPGEHFLSDLLSVYFHFWTKGAPEIIPFGMEHTRMTHGAQAAILYYQPGFRSAYVALKKGQHANENEQSKTNPFPTLLIVIKGSGTAIINGKTSTIRAGEAILIPAGITHEFLNPDHDEPLEGILLMFGEGA